MYSRCHTARSASQQRLIEQHLLENLQYTPYDKITILSLCEDCGLSRKTFYRLFDSKDDVLCALIDHTLLEYEFYVCPDEHAVDGQYNELARFFSYWLHCRPLLNALSLNGRGSLMLERCILHVKQDSSLFTRLSGSVPLPHSSQSLIFSLSGILGVLMDWHSKGYDKTVPEMAEIMYRLLTSPTISLDMP